MLFNLTFALLLSSLTFVSGVNQTSDDVTCMIVAALLHYLIMTSFMWMLMQALLQYFLFVRLKNVQMMKTSHVLRMAAISWGKLHT